MQLRWRRLIAISLNIVTITAFFAAMLTLLLNNGLNIVEYVMLAAYAITLPWLSIGFWNGIIGFVILNWIKDPAGYVNPLMRGEDPASPIVTRTAIVMAIRNEDPSETLASLEAIHRELAAGQFGHCFDIHILSDTSDTVIARREELLTKGWRRRPIEGPSLFYRRRQENVGFKAGNIGEFVGRCHQDYDFFLPLDADSSMSAQAILRLVRIMQNSPQLGILQGLVVGSTSSTFFTRAFQFGMRHGMRSFTLGSAWWQGDCGPFWGHNALIRIKPFHQHCQLPVLEGRGPLSGHILSHDQVEAALMRRAGYEVRVLAAEDESFERNPPSLPDFIKREVRWCLGNMQYWRLLGMKDLKLTSRIQLFLAIMMYASAPAWMLFVMLGAALAGGSSQFEAIPAGFGLGLFVVIMTFNLMPKLMGLMHSLADAETAGRYGGRTRLIAGGIFELVLSLLVAPAVALAITLCCIGLLFGRRMTWDAQQRSRRCLAWGEALHSLWPQTVLGAGLTLFLAWNAPWAMAFGAPVLLSLLLAVPFAVVTTAPILSAWSTRAGLFDIPEERVKISVNKTDEPAVQMA